MENSLFFFRFFLLFLVDRFIIIPKIISCMIVLRSLAVCLKNKQLFSSNASDIENYFTFSSIFGTF